jgi:heme-degrading monooxygenase HmoA
MFINCKSSISPMTIIFFIIFLSMIAIGIKASSIEFGSTEQGITHSITTQTNDSTAIHAQDSVMVGLTLAKLGSRFWKNIIFWRHSANVVGSLKQQPGYLGHAIKINLWKGEARTLTIWTDEASLDRFVESRTHRKAMDKGYKAMNQATFARVRIAKASLPINWDTARQLMETHGRTVDTRNQEQPSY